MTPDSNDELVRAVAELMGWPTTTGTGIGVGGDPEVYAAGLRESVDAVIAAVRPLIEAEARAQERQRTPVITVDATGLRQPDYVLALPNLAGWLNANDDAGGKLYYKRRKIVEAWRDAGRDHATRVGIPHLDRARIVAYCRFRDARRRDPGNFYPTAKAAVDGMVDAGVLDDDSTRYLIGPDMREGEIIRDGSLGLLVLCVYPLPAVTP